VLIKIVDNNGGFTPKPPQGTLSLDPFFTRRLARLASIMLANPYKSLLVFKNSQGQSIFFKQTT